MLARVNTSVINGIEALPVEVEAEISRSGDNKEFHFEIIGLADTAIREARRRVMSALKKTGVRIDQNNILVNLSPAEIKKDGTSFDLPIAVALLLAAGQIQHNCINATGFYGELALDGQIRGIRGVIAHSLVAKLQGWKRIFVPLVNHPEASLVNGVQVVSINSLAEIVKFFQDKEPPVLAPVPKIKKQITLPKLSEVRGQHMAKRALALSAAGQHNLLLVGPPGSGKSMLAQRLPSLLPSLSENEQLETAKIHSLAGLNTRAVLHGVRPFRAPHYLLSEIAMIGGGNPLAPGEISLAHNGILFLDELPEFKRKALESLRVPLEEKQILISRARYNFVLPANFQLVAAMNPCPCGRLGSSAQSCECSQRDIARYLSKVSLPLLDRIDLQVSLQPVRLEELTQAVTSEQVTDEERLVQKIHQARLINQENCREKGVLTQPANSLLSKFSERHNLSARGYFKILKISRTIASLEGKDVVSKEALAEALSYRSLDLIREYVSKV